MKKNCTGLKNIHYLNAAIGSRKGFVDIENKNVDNNSFKVILTNNNKSIKLYTINQILKKNSDCTPFIVKIDIEGFENDMFRENINWIKKTPIIIIELHDWLLPGKAVSKTFLKAHILGSRDFIICGENIFSLNNNTR